MIDTRKANRWKLPKVAFKNWNKYERAKGCFQRLSFKRFWGGRIWQLTFRGYTIELDFRLCPYSDMAFPNANKKDREECPFRT